MYKAALSSRTVTLEQFIKWVATDRCAVPAFLDLILWRTVSFHTYRHFLQPAGTLFRPLHITSESWKHHKWIIVLPASFRWPCKPIGLLRQGCMWSSVGGDLFGIRYIFSRLPWVKLARKKH